MPLLVSATFSDIYELTEKESIHALSLEADNQEMTFTGF